MEKANGTQDDPTTKFVLLKLARDIAVQAVDGELAFEAIDAMASDYDVNRIEMKAGVLEQAAKRSRLTPDQRAAIADAALKVIDAAIGEDNFDVAKRLGKQASQLARLSKDTDLLQEVVAKNKAVDAAAKAYADVEKAAVKLKQTPDDPDANTKVGKYLCFTKGDWQKGLQMLVKGSDASLKALATKDLAGAASGEAQVKLGDAWWDAGNKRRAVHWYTQALPGLTGFVKDRVEKRMEEGAATGASVAGAWTVIFRSANPAIWNTDIKQGRNAFAMSLAKVPDRVKYLRLKRCDTDDYVIIEMSKERLGTTSNDGRIGWNGKCFLACDTRWLGIYDKADDVNVPGHLFTDAGQNLCGGWGFGSKSYALGKQFYGWSGVEIPDTVFEIAVKSGPLSATERKCLLSKASGPTEWQRRGRR